MSIEISFLKGLRLYFSPAGKILRHMTKLRRQIDMARFEMARLKALNRIGEYYKVPHFHDEDIEALENMVASREKELANLQTALDRIASEKP